MYSKLIQLFIDLFIVLSLYFNADKGFENNSMITTQLYHIINYYHYVKYVKLFYKAHLKMKMVDIPLN